MLTNLSSFIPAAFPALALAHFLALLSPGPDFFLIIGHSVRHRLRGAVFICLGIALGNAVYIALAAAGWAVLRHSSFLYRCMEMASAAYLIWMGSMLLLSCRRALQAGDTAEPYIHEQTPLSPLRQLLAGLGSARLNPKMRFLSDIDGGHPCPNTTPAQQILAGIWMIAPSWQKVFKKFPNAKVVNLTATPFRGDGKKPDGTVIYKYPFSRAMINGYIKQIHSRNVAPEELYFTEKGSTRKLSLVEVMELREEAWFRRGIALSKECNMHIVEYSLNYLNELRERSGYKHQLIAAACSIDHARQVRSLYEERGCKAKEIYSEMDQDQKDTVIDELKRGKLDCIVQVQMLGEGFDHPNLSVAAIFRPYRSLAPYIQFVGRVMRVVFEGKSDSPDNHAYIVSHVGLNNDEQWDDFRELDLGDQEIFKKWINQQETEPDNGKGSGEPRRFDQGMLVNNEILSDFIASQTFLDPSDDRVLDEFLNKEIGPGIKLKNLMPREALRAKLEEFVQQSKQAENFSEIRSFRVFSG